MNERTAAVFEFPKRAVNTANGWGSDLSDAAQEWASLMTSPVESWSANRVDDWGRDNEFTNRVWAASHARWDISVGGTQHLPKRAGGLIVVNSRRWALAPFFAALAIGARVDRPVRFVGRPDIAPIGPMMQRLGGLLAVEDEIQGALRAGQLVVLGAAPTGTNHRCGAVDHSLVAAAVAARVNVFPAATVSTPTGREARVEIGTAIKLGRRMRGPLKELELAQQAQRTIDLLLGELGGIGASSILNLIPANRWAIDKLVGG